MPSVFFITHPDVVIKPSVPVRDWPLSERGRGRMRAMVAAACVHKVRSIFASSEHKAGEGAQILADGLGLSGYVVLDELCENDRSATGYLPKQEFEAMVDAFFAQPQTNIRGWEPAADAQARIICAIERILSQASGNGDIAIIGHGAPEHCSIVALRDCQLIGATISPRRMVETGSPSTEQVDDSYMTGGAQSMRQH